MIIKYVSTAIVAALVATPSLAAKNIDQTLKTGASPAVEVSNVAGKVTVRGWDRKEVQVTGVIEYDKDEFEFTADDKRVVIKVRPEKREDGRFESYHHERDAVLDIKVPAGSSLNAQTVSADIDVDGIRGTQRLESVSGDVETVGYDAALDVRTVSGDANVRGQGGAAATLATVSGDLTSRGLKGEVEAKSVSGELDVEVVDASRLRLKSVSGEIEALAGLTSSARAEIETVSGGITLKLKSPVNAEFDVESFSGGIDNCFGHEAQRKSKYAPGRELRFTQGSGGASVRINTLSGGVSFCDR